MTKQFYRHIVMTYFIAYINAYHILVILQKTSDKNAYIIIPIQCECPPVRYFFGPRPTMYTGLTIYLMSVGRLHWLLHTTYRVYIPWRYYVWPAVTRTTHTGPLLVLNIRGIYLYELEFPFRFIIGKNQMILVSCSISLRLLRYLPECIYLTKHTAEWQKRIKSGQTW